MGVSRRSCCSSTSGPAERGIPDRVPRPPPAAAPSPSFDAATLRLALEALLVRTDGRGRLENDPLSFVRRYSAPEDQEVAAVFAATLAFGRVSAFWPVLTALFAEADRHGGPRAWVEGFDAARASALAPLYYRWMRGGDFSLLAATLGHALRQSPRLGDLFLSPAPSAEPPAAGGPDIGLALARGVARLKAHSLSAAEGLGRPVAGWAELPRGFRVMLNSPEDGSACKRWCMLLRWMVRRGWPDLGLWALDPAALVIPLDTHVLRIGQMIGLTSRSDDSWRTALEITAALRRLDPQDPVRYDFALAHLGISGACKRERVDAICGACALQTVCRVGRGTG